MKISNKFMKIVQLSAPGALLSCVLLFTGAFACGERSGGDWKFALEEIEGSVQDAYAKKFKELIEKKSGGKVKVTVYPYGTLGTSDQLTELVQNGTLQFAMATPGHLGKVIPELQVFSLPFIFSKDDMTNRKILSPEGEYTNKFKAMYSDKGLRLLAFYPEGWQVWTTNRSITKPSDFAGFKMRVMTSPLLVETYKAYGANPVPLPYAEVYSGLQLKMIDGQVNPVFAIEEMSFYEVTEHMIFPKATLFVTSAITNRPFYDALPDEKKRWIDESILELNDFIFEVQERFNSERLEKIKKKKPDLKISELTNEQREAFRKAAMIVREKFIEMSGDGGRKVLDFLDSQVASYGD